MPIRLRLAATLSFAAALVWAGAAPAPAQPGYAVGGSQHLIEVRRCEPTRSVTSMPVGGYAPGFYPPGPYWWDDVYRYPYYQRPVAVTTSQSAELAIDYLNVTHYVMSTIEFGLVANGRLVAEVRDVGKFSPRAEIKHRFGLDPNVFPLGTGLPQCVPLRVTYADGTQWVNPHLPALQRSIYGHP